MTKTLIATAAAASLFSAGWATAQTMPAPAPTTAPAATANADRPVNITGSPIPRRDRGADFRNVKDQLEQQLRGAAGRADYAKVLEQNGYRISSINADRPDYLEYEIVKGDRSYEVQLDFDSNAPKASKIDVTTNMWRTDATKRMLADANYRQAGPLVADPEGRFSDRRYMKGWTDEKERLEKALEPNMQMAEYRRKLEQMGYQVTAVNDREPDYIEYEIVKGDHSYEVQIDMDPKSKIAKKVDVTTSVWEAAGTERAKGDKKVLAPAK